MYNITRLGEGGACGTNFTPFKTRVPKYILLPGRLHTNVRCYPTISGFNRFTDHIAVVYVNA